MTKLILSFSVMLQETVAFFKVGSGHRAAAARPKFAGHPTKSIGAKPSRPARPEDSRETGDVPVLKPSGKALVLSGTQAEASDKEFERY